MRRIGAFAVAMLSLVAAACGGDEDAGAGCWQEVASRYKDAGDQARPILGTYANNLGSRYGGLNQVASASDESYYDTYVRRDLHGIVQGLEQVRRESGRFAWLRREADRAEAACKQSDVGNAREACWERAAHRHRDAVEVAVTAILERYRAVFTAVERVAAADDRDELRAALPPVRSALHTVMADGDRFEEQYAVADAAYRSCEGG
jgi:hypothetical protein